MNIADDLKAAYDEGFADGQKHRFGEDTNVPTKWISVEDRLPEPTQNVLVCKTFRGKPYVDIGCVIDAETCRCASDEYIIKPWLHRLTHWMPLPEPPKGGEA